MQHMCSMICGCCHAYHKTDVTSNNRNTSNCCTMQSSNCVVILVAAHAVFENSPGKRWLSQL